MPERNKHANMHMYFKQLYVNVYAECHQCCIQSEEINKYLVSKQVLHKYLYYSCMEVLGKDVE